MSESPKWIQKAKDTHNFHCKRLALDEKWRTTNTAKALRRSIGSISEDLLIARWLRTHEVKLEKFKYAYEALEFIREQERKQEMDEIT